MRRVIADAGRGLPLGVIGLPEAYPSQIYILRKQFFRKEPFQKFVFLLQSRYNFSIEVKVMKGKKSIQQFVYDTIAATESFDPNNPNSLKEIIKAVIHYYELKTDSVLEGKTETLYLASIAEENILTRAAQLAVGDKEDITIEEVYNSQVVRKH
ncbi:hypothetical protein J2S74_000870 [Evansella vedderi]|uniref:Uncharacterized protein n=1 Tax=Evansella vedderi TaxID=38282 RepID=A0ABT9ZQI2_9BACI|nr:DUF6407 family protein [Evansella vedderi]MDQ0253498.1 hypothetical protein [Evansella vedderi]